MIQGAGTDTDVDNTTASLVVSGAVAGAVVGWATVALLAPVQGLVVAGDPVQISPRGDRVEP